VVIAGDDQAAHVVLELCRVLPDARVDQPTILWRHTSGLVHLWVMDGPSVISASAVTSVTADWSIERLGDFNGDARRTSSGATPRAGWPSGS
jgi:hypothetical protein